MSIPLALLHHVKIGTLPCRWLCPQGVHLPCLLLWEDPPCCSGYPLLLSAAQMSVSYDTAPVSTNPFPSLSPQDTTWGLAATAQEEHAAQSTDLCWLARDLLLWGQGGGRAGTEAVASAEADLVLLGFVTEDFFSCSAVDYSVFLGHSKINT